MEFRDNEAIYLQIAGYVGEKILRRQWPPDEKIPSVRELAGGALERLCAWDWPGNVRALRHACERAVILGAQPEYRFEDFGLAAPAPVPVQAPAPAPAPAREDGDFKLGALERETIAAALDKAKGNISLAARMLGLSRAALYRKLGKHGI